MTQTPAGDVAKFLEARTAYRESMHPGDRALMSDIVATQPVQAEITRDSTIRTVELTEAHLSGMLRELADAIERLRVARTRIQLARRALIRDGYFSGAEVGDDLAPRIIELLGVLRRDNTETHDQLNTVLGAIGTLTAENARLRITLGDVLRAFDQPGCPGYDAVRTHWVPRVTVDKWRATLEELTPPPVDVELPTVAIGADDPAADIPSPAESP